MIYYCKIFCNTTPNVQRRHIEWAKNVIIGSFLADVNKLSSSNWTDLNRALQDLELFYGTKFLGDLKLSHYHEDSQCGIS